ncbi:MAG: S41 family peptidase [Alphaproteobacteria bacterium]
MDTGSDQSVPVLKSAFRNLESRYAVDPKLDRLAVVGLNGVTATDPLAAVRRAGDRILVSYGDVDIGEWTAAEPHDHDGWALLVDGALNRLRDVSHSLRETGKERVLEMFFDSGLAELDRYTRYATPDQARNTRARREGFGGIGITIRYEDGHTWVSTVYPETPASKAGLLPGDEITHVSSTSLSGLPQRDVIDRLRGPVHSHAELTLKRPAEDKPIKVDIVRAHIMPPTVTSRRDGPILYIAITGFNQGTSRALGQVLAEAERVETDVPGGIVLDLRANPGGLLDQAVAVADFFLNDGRIISTQGRHKRSNQIFDASWGERMRDIPMVLLVNGRSASASEIVAAALRDRFRAVVVGSSSFGKGTVQTIVRLPNNGELTMTWAHLIAPSGFNLHTHGVIPAICTSASESDLSEMKHAVQAPGPVPGGVFDRLLSSRLAVRKDPDQARRNCPPNLAQPDDDLEVAKFLLSRPKLYARALSDGQAAIAERPE